MRSKRMLILWSQALFWLLVLPEAQGAFALLNQQGEGHSCLSSSSSSSSLAPFCRNRRFGSTALEQSPGNDNDGEMGFYKGSGILVSERMVDTRQAGTDGYSVIRQPLSRSNWDPNASPNNEVPLLLEDNNNQFSSVAASWQDEQWWKRTSSVKNGSDDFKSLSKSAGSSNVKSKRMTGESQEEEKLDLFKRTFDTLDYPRILRALSEEHASTMPARNILMNRQPKAKRKGTGEAIAFQPFLADTVEGARERYRAVQELEWLLEGKKSDGGTQLSNDYYFRNIRGYKESIVGRPAPTSGNSFALEPILQAAMEGGLVLESPQLLEISTALDQMKNIQSWGKALSKVEEIEFVELPKLVDCISLNETLYDLLRSALDQEGRLSGVTFPTIGRLRARVKALRGEILNTLESLVKMPSIQSKLATESGGAIFSEINGGRLVIPLQAGSDSKQRQVSSVGIVHDTSRSGRTVYVEPTEIVGPTNELRQAEGELRSEEARIWRYLTQQVLVNQRDLEQSIYAVGQLDLVLARLRIGQSWHGLVPAVDKEGVMCLRNAKHPVLVIRKKEENVVGSDIDLGANRNQGLVLTGPNSGGKTVILKMIGLMALLARGGVPVPASPGDYEPRVDFFDPVLADIGDIQSVGGDLSTFSGHMLVCKQVLENAGKNALVLMDELGSGTDPAQGVAIAQALLEAILEKGSRAVITTHYMQLKQLAASDDRFSVAGMQFVGGRPTYKLLPGTVGESFALAVAERLELPQSVLKRANELLDAPTRKMGDLIRELEDQKALVDRQVEELEEKKQEMVRLEFELKERQRILEKRQLDVRREEARKFAKKLEEKEQILENILAKLKSDPSRKLVAKSWDDIKFVKRDVLNEAENVPSVLAMKQRVAAEMEQASAEMIPLADLGSNMPVLEEGDAVVICKAGPLFAREAYIVKVMGNKVEVRVNNMNVAFKLSDIALPPKGGNRAQSQKNERPGHRSESKALQRALAYDQENGVSNRNKQDEWEAARSDPQPSSPSGRRQFIMRTQSNTVDVRGCTLMEAQEKIMNKISTTLMSGINDPVVFILHGHGTSGVLKAKIRQWLKQKGPSLIKSWSPADASDGGDALTRVDLK